MQCLSIDQEQDAGNYGTNPCNKVDDVPTQTYTQQGKTGKDQVYPKQNPFKTTHFYFSFRMDEQLPGRELIG